MHLHVDQSFMSYSRDAFAVVNGLVPAPIHVKLESLNPCGSIKLVPALQLLDDLEKSGKLNAKSTVIESSSGNLGIALSSICANRGIPFICVTDPNSSTHSVALMKAFGAKVIVVKDRDAAGGFLASRIRLIQEMCLADTSLVWVNQYANPSNWLSHFNHTAPEIANRFPHIDWLFVGAGTTGTLMGCAKYFNKYRPLTKLIAIDSSGSVTFGAKSGPRFIPGLGTSRRPEILDESVIGEIHYVDERKAVDMCRAVAKKGLLLGGSTGTVLSGIRDFADRIQATDVVVTISPDLGDKYLTTVYNDNWVDDTFKEGVREATSFEMEQV